MIAPEVRRVLWRLQGEQLAASDAEPPSRAALESAAGELTAGLRLAIPPAPVLDVGVARSAPSDDAEAADGAGAQLDALVHAFADPEDVEGLLERLQSDPRVTDVEIQERPVAVGFAAAAAAAPAPGPGAAATPDLRARQGYLIPAPAGVGAVGAWTVAGGNGRGAVVIDVQYGWRIDHEDLVNRQLGCIRGVNRQDDHGTSSMGVVSADNNDIGVLGVSFGCHCGGSSILDATGAWNIEDAVVQAVRTVGKGGVVLCELQTPALQPAEVSKALRRVFAWATGLGTYVVAVAGNGGSSIDAVLPRQADSGSILVAAAGVGSAAPRRHPHPLSNFGDRVDLHAWGEGVATCGGLEKPEHCDLFPDPDPRRCYTGSFMGTSSAAAIVAGVVACVVGAVRAKGRPDLTPAQMRHLLVSTGTPQAGVPAKKIGPQPDLIAAFTMLGLP